MAVAPAFTMSVPALDWDPFQRDALAEEGHRLYRMCGDGRPGIPATLEAAEGVPVPTDGDRLWRALVRAAGTDALPQLELEALRRDPAAKRALWPRLRALRGAARAR